MQGVSPQATVATVASCGVTVSRSQAEHATHRQAPGIHIFQSAFAFVVSAMILSRPLPLFVFLGVVLVRQGGEEISSTKTW